MSTVFFSTNQSVSPGMTEPRVSAASASPANLEDALRRARSLCPRIAARAARAEADRTIPPETIQELLDCGLFGIVMARTFGGSELGMAALVEVTAQLASACGSTGWVFGVLAGHSWLLNLFPIEAQQEFHEDPRALAATVFRLNAQVTPVEGGYRLQKGLGRFCSGVDHSNWIIASSSIKAHGSDENARFFLVPRKEVQIVDDWFTAGMRGTGSRSIRIEDAFIPAHRSVRLAEIFAGNAPGALLHKSATFRTPYQDVAAFSIIGAPLGLARRAVVSFSDSLRAKLAGISAEQIAEASTTISRIGHAAADIDAAFALIVADARSVDRADDPDGRTALQRAHLARDWAYAAHQCRYAVDSLFEAAGGAGIFDTSELQRIWRDVNSAAQHFAFVWDTAMTNFGRAALGLGPAAWLSRAL